MPYAAPRFCPAPGCPQLTNGQRCQAHRQAWNAANDARRGSPAERGYDRTWQRLRKQKLAVDPFCQIRTLCTDLPITRGLATEVDHIIPIKQRPDLRLEWTNLQSACKPCHSAKTMQEMRRQKTTVYPEGLTR
jgi:5-methylcytosine-specific restriction protein A